MYICLPLFVISFGYPSGMATDTPSISMSLANSNVAPAPNAIIIIIIGIIGHGIIGVGLVEDATAAGDGSFVADQDGDVKLFQHNVKSAVA